MHGQTAGLGGNLSVDEVQVIRGALDLTHKTAINCMTPLDKVQHPGSMLWCSYTDFPTGHDPPAPALCWSWAVGCQAGLQPG